MKRRQIDDVLRALDKLITGSVAMRLDAMSQLMRMRCVLGDIKEWHRAKNWK